MTDASDTYDDIVKEYMIGNTTILVSEAAYKDKTTEEIEKILRRVTAIGWEIINHTLEIT